MNSISHEIAFKNQPAWVKSAAINKMGNIVVFETTTDNLKIFEGGYDFISNPSGKLRCKVVGNVIHDNWEQSAIDRDFTKFPVFNHSASAFKWLADFPPMIRHDKSTGKDSTIIQPLKIIQDRPQIKLSEKYPHYHKNVEHLTSVDVYRVLKLFEVTDPCAQHAVKKLLCMGRRGAKDRVQDIKEARDTLDRALHMLEEDSKT